MSDKRITKRQGTIHSIAGAHGFGIAKALFAAGKQKIARVRTSPADVRIKDCSDLVGGLNCATAILRAGSNKSRLVILCRLAKGVCQIDEFEELLMTNRAVVSMHLSQLRMDGLVNASRIGQVTFFSLKDERTKRFFRRISRLVCANSKGQGINR